MGGKKSSKFGHILCQFTNFNTTTIEKTQEKKKQNLHGISSSHGDNWWVGKQINCVAAGK